MSAQAVGGILGGVVIAHLGTRVPPIRLLGPSAIVCGVIDLAIFNYPAVWPGIQIALVLFAVVGLPAAAFNASFSTLMQGATQDTYRGRIFGAQGTTFALMTLGGMALASGLGDILGITTVLNIQGITPIIAGILVLMLLPWRGTRAVNRTSAHPVTSE